MSIIDTVKDIGVLIQKIDNLELLKRMVELQEQVYALVSENRDLKEANRGLSEKLQTREQMQFRQNAYWRGDEGPFCSQCFDAEGLSVRMHVGKGHSPICRKCKTVAMNPDAEPPKPARRGTSSWIDGHRRGGY